MTASVKLAYLNKQYDIREDELLGSAYSEHDDLTGNYMTVGVDSLAIYLAELSSLHSKKTEPYKKDIATFNQALKYFNQVEKSNLYYAINHEQEIFTNKELQLIIMRFGTFIEDQYYVKQDVKGRKERENYINKLNASINGSKLVV